MSELPRVLGPVRKLTAEDLGVGYTSAASQDRAASAPDSPSIDPNDPNVVEAIRLLRLYSGVILTGAPGTSKSYLAAAVARVMTDPDESRRAFVQFHPSYQYEDFMEGYRPNEANGGFEWRAGVFLDLCLDALKEPGKDFVIVVDELSRGDAARVFGEALTYVEKSKRAMTFSLPSGREVSIPPNVYIIATMNPLDRGVDEVDAAFERRFAKLEMPPDPALLESRLTEQGLDEKLRTRLLAWFRRINGQAKQTPAAALGHTYFWDVTDEQTLRDAWEYQVKYHVGRAFRYDQDAYDSLAAAWEAIFVEPSTGE